MSTISETISTAKQNAEISSGEEIKKKCESCTSNFNLFRRKRNCYFCKLTYCHNCVELCFLNNNTSNTNNNLNRNRKNKRVEAHSKTCRSCSNCLTMSSPRSSYDQLMSIDIKYLKLFLTNTNTSGLNRLTDKSQFVDLVISKTRNELNTSVSINVNTSLPDVSDLDNSNYDYKIRASLSDLTSIDDIEKLNVKRIKEILKSNFVHYTKSSERPELINKLKKLYISSEDNKNKNSKLCLNECDFNPTDQTVNTNQDICKICMEFFIDCVLSDCGHMIVCTHCAKQLNECPICRSQVMKIIRVFKS